MKFIAENKEYTLDEDKFDGFFNDEENPIENITKEDILNILEDRELDFEVAYYDYQCQECKSRIEGVKKAYKFLEYHFYLYTKNNELIISDLEAEEKEESFNKLLREGKVDNSYIVSIIVCAECGVYTIEIEEFEI